MGCIFCGSSDLSNEHVFAQWLLEYFNIKMADFVYTRYSVTGDIKSTRRHVLNKFLNGHVCKKCNNEFLGEIENSAKNIIIGLNNGTEEISEKYSHILSKWFFKTAIQLNYCANSEHIVPKEHYSSFREGIIPENTYIDFAFSNFKTELFWWQGRTMQLTFDDNVEIKIIENARSVYNITIQFGKLLFRVTHLSKLKVLERKGIIGYQLYPKYEVIQNKIITDPTEYHVNNAYVVE